MTRASEPPKKFGWLDATIFVHALFANDPHRDRCRGILEALESGKGEAWVDVVVIHELTYVLPRVLPLVFSDRTLTAEYLLNLLSLDALRAQDKDLLIASLDHWSTSRIGFADARLLTLGHRGGLPVCSVNKRDFPSVRNTF